jgi:class 3 adenylate cyclase/CHASE2 domain-containing sensor protein
MPRLFRATQLPLLIGVVTLVGLAAGAALMPQSWRNGLRETGFDQVLTLDRALRRSDDQQTKASIVVVDIDRRSLEALGPWPWPRATIARLVDAIAAGKPKAVTTDILFADRAPRSGVAPAHTDGGLHPGVMAVADNATEGDQQLAQASRDAPLVLGFVLDPDRRVSVPQVPIITRGEPRLDGLLRLVPVSEQVESARTVSAADLLAGGANAARLEGAIVLLGGSAPELGGLRETVGNPLTPSVQIQANAIEQISNNRFPRPISRAGAMQPLLVSVVGALALAASVALTPVFGTLALLGIILVTWAEAVAGSLLFDRLIDPLTPSLAGVAVFAVTAITSFAVTHRREVLLRRRFEQHLAPEVVRRIVDQPALIKLTGERREVTSMFTDVEGFTSLTHRADPERLVEALDYYFEGITALVVEHGGMVDKIVGDAVHALFNAPLDLADHPRQAVACAIALRSWTADYRKLPGPAVLKFGRTRIGIETGEAVVGDVGLRSKLDYTAYGDAVNAASRLEAANKELGSSICVGPAAAARCEADLLRPLGMIKVRGRDEPLAVFEPWPSTASVAWRERYRATFALIERDPAQAAALFDALATDCADDPVPKVLAARIRGRLTGS